MEMKVNSKLIKSERKKRAWTQEHLASVTGLGSRTIQRIERTGSAAPESLKALASAFNLKITSLQIDFESHSNSRPFFNARKISLTALIAVLILITSLITVRTSLAEDVKLEYAISIKDQENEISALESLKMGNELIDKGQSLVIEIDDLKLEVTPTIQENGSHILIAVKVFEYIDGEYSVRAEPKVMVADSEQAAITSASKTGDQLSIFLTPSIQ